MNYYREIDRSKVQFDFMVHRAEPGHYDKEIRDLGGRIYPMPSIRPGNYRLYFRRLDKFFAEHREYRVVHAHINENSSFVLRSARKAGIPCRIAHSHLSDLGIDLKLPFRLYARWAMRDHPNHYFACSRKAGEWLYGKSRLAEHSLTVLNNAVDVSRFTPNPETRQRVRDELGATDHHLVIGHVGRFNQQKNHDFLIDIFHAVRERQPDSLLILVGDGHLRPGIEQKVRKLGLEQHVRFLGLRSDIADLMQGMDLFLFPSLFEGLPVVMVEAQASGLPCIVSDTITPEVDMTGRVRFLSLKQSADEWAERLLLHPTDRADTGSQLRDNGYDAATMADWLVEYYRKHG